jgi:Rab-like protein 3
MMTIYVCDLKYDVMYFQLHDYKAGTPAEKTYFIELWDIGGWAAHKNSRGIFYNPVHGMSLDNHSFII